MLHIILLLVLGLMDDPEQLVQELGANSWHERELAQKKLISLEDKALPALYQGLKGTDEEIKGRCIYCLDIYYDISDVRIGMRWLPENYPNRRELLFKFRKKEIMARYPNMDILDITRWMGQDPDKDDDELATLLFLNDAMLHGMTRHDMLNLVKQMEGAQTDAGVKSQKK